MQPDSGWLTARQPHHPDALEGGKPPRATGAGSIHYHVDAEFIEATTERPDGSAVQFESVSQFRHEGGRVSHGQQDTRSSGDAPLGASMAHQFLHVGGLFWREADELRGTSSHPPELFIPATMSNDFVVSPLVMVNLASERVICAKSRSSKAA
jgi:hypothetical protein